MPLYEYQCFVCDKRFEKIQKVNADPVRECPFCSGSVRRLLGVPALQFKGSGWYVTDYGSGRSEASSTTGESTSANGGDGAKSDSGSAGTADKKSTETTSSAPASVTSGS